MSRPTRCDYFRGITDLNALTRACELFARDIHDRLLVGRLEGDNLSDSLLKADGGLTWSRLPNEPKRLMAPLLSTKTAPAVREKDGAGVELVVDADNSTSGRVCIVDKDNLGTQQISFVPDDPADGTSGGAVDFPAGIGVLRTSGNFNLQLARNSTVLVELTSTHIEASDDLLPNADGTVDLGASAQAWRETFTRTIDSGSATDLIFQRNNTEVGRFTATLLALGGTAATNAALKPTADASVPYIAVRKGDDSAYGDVHARSAALGTRAAGVQTILSVSADGANKAELVISPTAPRTITFQDSTHTLENTVHASKHLSGGSDAIKLDDLAAPDDNTDLNVSTTAHGLCPKAPNSTTQFLRGDATWAAPSGKVVQIVGTEYSGVATATATTPIDDTIPQFSEGGNFMSRAITPTSLSNRLLIICLATMAYSVASQVVSHLHRDSAADALSATIDYVPTGTAFVNGAILHDMAVPTVLSTTFQFVAGGEQAGTLTFNGYSSAQKLGTTPKSRIMVIEYEP